tara:strand:+ start:140 stop:406 length:267 start_codon:yes stop_codon:yes gene_type:complete
MEITIQTGTISAQIIKESYFKWDAYEATKQLEQGAEMFAELKVAQQLEHLNYAISQIVNELYEVAQARTYWAKARLMELAYQVKEASE